MGMGASPGPGRRTPQSAVLEGWLYGGITLLVLLALASVALLVWEPLPGMTTMLGTALLGVSCMLGGGYAARRVGHMGLLLGLATGALLAASALVVMSFLEGSHMSTAWLRFGTGTLGGALGGAFGLLGGGGQ